MRILLVANTLPPTDISGVGEQVLQLASGLRTRGHEVEVLGRGESGARGPKVLFPFTVVPAFVRCLLRFRPHVVQVHESDGALVALLTKILAAVVEPSPVIVSLLQVSYLEEIRAVRKLTFKGRVLGAPGAVEKRFRLLKAPIQIAFGCLTAWLSDLVLAPSLVTAGEIERDYAVAAVGVVPNVTGGLDWDVAAEDGEVDAARHGLLFVGRLRIRKAVEVLLAAMELLLRRAPQARLSIVGDGEQRRSLEKMARQLNLQESVKFLGRQDPQGVRQLLASSQALVVPSIYEGMPLVVLEAMEREVPVVASAVSGIPEVVVDGETGWLVESEDPEQLAHALAQVIEQPREALRRGRNGRLRVTAEFRPANAARRWESALAVCTVGIDG